MCRYGNLMISSHESTLTMSYFQHIISVVLLVFLEVIHGPEVSTLGV
jgi:hypothetical protein